MKNGNEPAYPIDANDGFPACYGLTKREQIAIFAMNGLLMRRSWHEADAAREAVKCADALLLELEKKK